MHACIHGCKYAKSIMYVLYGSKSITKLNGTYNFGYVEYQGSFPLTALKKQCQAWARHSDLKQREQLEAGQKSASIPVKEEIDRHNLPWSLTSAPSKEPLNIPVYLPGMPSFPQQEATIPQTSPQLNANSPYLQAFGFLGTYFSQLTHPDNPF